MIKVSYTYLEAEAIENDYDEQVPLKVIAENINRDFHEGQPVRSERSVRYVVDKMNNDDEWRSRLEEKWLSGLSAEKGAE